MEIQVGEYVRTKNGVIGKVGKIVTYERATYKNRYFSEYVEKGNVTYNKLIAIQKDIVKHSFDIIDLIEAGDYVNGHKIEYIWEDAEHYRFGGCNYMFQITDDKIKSIVTKEQFESMIYKVEV